MLSLDFRAHSETGLVRKNNQDSVLASPTALVVADGMGGAAAGDLASAIAIHEIARADERLRAAAGRDGDGEPLDGDDLLGAFTGAVSRANDLIADLVSEEPVLDGMGTTVCGAFFNGTHLGTVHIGDSRGYLLRDGRLTRLSHDHSWVQSLVDDGRLHEADMATHPHRSLLLRVLNGQSAETDTSLVEVRPGDRVMFCSDGLSGFAPDTEIGRILQLPRLDDVVAELIQAAHRGGGADNITFAVADLVAQDAALDARPPVQMGAVADAELGEILAMATQSPQQPGTASPVRDGERHERDTYEHGPGVDRATADDAHEALRYAPTRRHRRWLPTVALLSAVVLAIGAAGVGGLLYSRTQYYVGVAPATNGASVAVFRGLPDNVLGLRLSSLQQVDDTLVGDLPSYYRQQVEGTIGADSLDAARQTAQQLSAMAQQCVALRAKASADASASASASAAKASAASASAAHASSARSSTARPSGTKPSAARTTPGAPASTSPSAPVSTPSHASTSAPATPSAVPTGSLTLPGNAPLTLQDCS